jgi:hypothetical protein
LLGTFAAQRHAFMQASAVSAVATKAGSHLRDCHARKRGTQKVTEARK